MRSSSSWFSVVAAVAAVLIPRWASAGPLGRACASDAECGVGLTCFQADATEFDGEGPAKGLCTTSCAADASLCAQFDPAAVCLTFENQNAFCLEGCTFGPPGLTQFDPLKCHGRQEVGCAAFLDASGNFLQGACFPQCNSNADCGGGLTCNPESGLCGSVAPSGKGLGEPCTQAPDGGVDDCAGTCIGFVHVSGQDPFTYMCAENCTLGAAPSCGWSGPGTGPAPAACLFVSTIILDNGGAGIGDLGSCGQLCDCNSDCKNPDLVCNGWTGTAASQNKAFFGKEGYCSDPLMEDGGVSLGLCVSDAGTGGSGTGGAGTGATGSGGVGGGFGGSGTGAGGAGGGGGVGPGDAGTPGGGSSSSGCGCRTAPSSVSSVALAWMAAMLALGLGRRKRRSKTE